MPEGFAALLRTHRLRQQLTQEALAERAGISSRSIREMERGQGRGPRPATVQSLAEALAHGKYCVCSSSSSLPEIAGDLLDYHDPLDLAGCASLVERALFEPGWLARKEERIRREFRVTPWRACAASVLEKLARHLAAPPAAGKVA